MAKVFSIHELELRPGVISDAFERFLTTEYFPRMAPLPAGWSVSYLKGNRGERDGKYAECRDKIIFTDKSVSSITYVSRGD